MSQGLLSRSGLLPATFAPSAMAMARAMSQMRSPCGHVSGLFVIALTVSISIPLKPGSLELFCEDDESGDEDDSSAKAEPETRIRSAIAIRTPIHAALPLRQIAAESTATKSARSEDHTSEL